MKSASEWQEAMPEIIGSGSIKDFIRAIQTDALKAAAIIIRVKRDSAKELSSEHPGEVQRYACVISEKLLDKGFKDIMSLIPKG